MIISKKDYYRNFLLLILIVGMLLSMGIPIVNKYTLKIKMVDKICENIFWIEIIMISIVYVIKLIYNHGLKNYIEKRKLYHKIEENLISIGAYDKSDTKAYAKLPKIKIEDDQIRISLKNLKIRTIIEKYLDSFSTALPETYIVEDYYITQNNAEVVINFENIKTYCQEEYAFEAYKEKISSLNPLELYIDKKHIVDLKNYPHFLISGSSGSGKTYFVNQLVVQGIIKQWKVIVLDLKRSYGLFRTYTEYCYELDDIYEKLISIESEMNQRLKEMEVKLDKNPTLTASDMGYKPIFVVIEEYISLQSAYDKKKKEEVERIVKNLSVLARQTSIHIVIVMQSAGTENINSTTRANLTKVLLGQAQSNILTATFGTGVDLPKIHTKLNKGEGLIQLDRISIVRIPKIEGIEDIKSTSLCGAEGIPQKDF